MSDRATAGNAPAIELTIAIKTRPDSDVSAVTREVARLLSPVYPWLTSRLPFASSRSSSDRESSCWTLESLLTRFSYGFLPFPVVFNTLGCIIVYSYN